MLEFSKYYWKAVKILLYKNFFKCLKSFEIFEKCSETSSMIFEMPEASKYYWKLLQTYQKKL